MSKKSNTTMTPKGSPASAGSGATWENVEMLKASFCVKLLLQSNHKRTWEFVDDLALGRIAVTEENEMPMISRKEFDLWRNV
jgi:hypothetical protein